MQRTCKPSIAAERNKTRHKNAILVTDFWGSTQSYIMCTLARLHSPHDVTRTTWRHTRTTWRHTRITWRHTRTHLSHVSWLSTRNMKLARTSWMSSHISDASTTLTSVGRTNGSNTSATRYPLPTTATPHSKLIAPNIFVPIPLSKRLYEWIHEAPKHVLVVDRLLLSRAVHKPRCTSYVSSRRWSRHWWWRWQQHKQHRWSRRRSRSSCGRCTWIMSFGNDAPEIPTQTQCTARADSQTTANSRSTEWAGS